MQVTLNFAAFSEVTHADTLEQYFAQYPVGDQGKGYVDYPFIMNPDYRPSALKAK